MEAWEHIAPEWPPGTPDGTIGLADEAWFEYERATAISKKRYAELIAVERVREAVERRTGKRSFSYSFCEEMGHGFSCWIASGNEGRSYRVRGNGPDICTAALATIKALGGGE